MHPILVWTLAAAPILIVLYGMTGRKWGGARSGAIGWLAAVAVAVLIFGATGPIVVFSQVRGCCSPSMCCSSSGVRCCSISSPSRPARSPRRPTPSSD